MERKNWIMLLIIIILSITSLYDDIISYINKDSDEIREIYYDEAKKEGKSEEDILPRFNDLLAINPEVVGWIKIPNTNIDYPVVKTDDNEFYLDHDFRREPEIRGAIYMDYRNESDASDRHTIIYGHQSRLGIMFTELNKFREQNFFENNKIIYLTTLYEEQEWQIFAVYETSTSFHYIVTEFSSDASFLSTVAQFQERSKFNRDVNITVDDQILTLSTCVYGVDNMRFVVQAKRIN